MVGRRFLAWVKSHRKGAGENIPIVPSRPLLQLEASSSGSTPTLQRRKSDGEQSGSAIRLNLSLRFDLAQQVEQRCRSHPFLVITSLFRAQLVMPRHNLYPFPRIASPFWAQQAERHQGSQLFPAITPPFPM